MSSVGTTAPLPLTSVEELELLLCGSNGGQDGQSEISSALRRTAITASHLFTRDLMFEAVPYSVVNMLLACEICDPAQSQRVYSMIISQYVRGGKIRVIHDVPAPRDAASMFSSFRYRHISMAWSVWAVSLATV